MIRALLLGGLVVVSGCTWVKLSDAGALVAQADTGAVSECTRVGIVTTQTKSTVVVERGQGKVQEELLVLARNEAATLGADTVVASGPPVAGSQDFEAYRCDQQTSE